MRKGRKDYPFMDEIREDYQLLIREGKINNSTKIPFMCKEHGEYLQILKNHSSGHGCPKCGSIKHSKSARKTEYSFINEIHPDYQQLINDRKITSCDKVPFICQKHGIYWQSLNNHSNGSGCSKCAIEKRMIGNKEQIK